MRTRRLATGLLCTLALASLGSPRPARAEIVLYRHAVVFSARSDRPDATWFVVDDGRFADLGAGAVPSRWDGARVVDLGGRFVSPGFIDAHVHLVDGGLGLAQVDASDAASATDLIKAVQRATLAPIGEWVVVRNAGLKGIGGALPTHARMAAIGAAAAERPLLIVLEGGHHAYANKPALARLGFAAGGAESNQGNVARDPDGAPTGLLVDDAAWAAMRAVADALTPEQLAQAIVLAERLALRYGITSIGDNTFDPRRMAQYLRMSEAGQFHLRVSARSFGLQPITRFTMKSQGIGLAGKPNPKIRFFGDKYFLDGALVDVAASRDGRQNPDGPRYSVTELRDILLFARPFGTAFHTQSREGSERLVAARRSIRDRLGDAPDIIDHCGRCGGGDLPEQIRASGFRITVLAGQLHDLPPLLAASPPEDREELLAIRRLFAADLKPALTSDWPFGTAVNYPEFRDGPNRLGFAPLAGVAVAVSGRTPDGLRIKGADTRTITVGQAMLGITAHGAAAIGREDVGQIAPGMRADFVVLGRDPFVADPVGLYRLDPDETFIDGRRVSAAGEDAAAADVTAFASAPRANALSPIIGYDPIPGILLGAAWFFYPYSSQGLRGSVQVFAAPAQATGRLELELVAMRLLGDTSPRLWLRADTLRDRYYGVGMDTAPGVFDETRPVRLDVQAGVSRPLGDHVYLGAGTVFTYLHEGAADKISARVSNAEGPIGGADVGGRLELSHDTRDNGFSTRFGGRRLVWLETHGMQGGRASFRLRAGGSVSQFVPLRAPDLILALRAEGGITAGDVAYATDFSLGGGDLLRGYYSNRFRGQHYAAASAELRFPLVAAFSGVVFGDAGHVWAVDHESTRVAETGGIGLRYGLLPDRQIRLRLDVGFGRDQWGVFFKFNEAF